MSKPVDSEALIRFRKTLFMKQHEMATKLGVPITRYKNWEYGHQPPGEIIHKLIAMGFGNDVGGPTIPAPQLLIPVPYIGEVAASSEVDWVDPFDSDTFEYVPPEMGMEKGRFSAKVIGDSMYDLLVPGDVVVFQRTDIPKIGHVVLFRSFDNKITIKTLKHDGTNYLLEAINQVYETVEAKGSMIGYLVGIVREQGSRRVTVYDSTGIRQ
ncbi:MAG: S24 family peptidase [Armatimonadota bacterium]